MSQKLAEFLAPAEWSTATTAARVGIVYPRATLDSAPSLCNAAELLARRGYAVDIFTCVHPGAAPPRIGSHNIHIRSLGPEAVGSAGAHHALTRVGGVSAIVGRLRGA